MKFAGSMKTLMLLLMTAALSACGGGGGGGNDSGFNPPGVNLSASTASVGINTRSAVAITVRLTQASGQAVPNGTAISGVVNGAGLGNLAAVGSGTNGGTAQGTTNGGAVNFIFQSGGAPATGSITFSAQDPTTPARNVSTNVSVSVSAGPGSDPRISFQPEKTQLPINRLNVGFFFGSPFISEVLINVRSASGQAINTTPTGAQAVQLSVDPLTLGAVSADDDPATPVNERTTPFASIFTGVASGTTKAYVWSDNTEPGNLNLRASFTDPDTGQRVDGVLAFQIVSAIPPLPASVTVIPPSSPIYVRNSGGNTTGAITVAAFDGNNQPVPNPISGNNAYNNVRLEILQPSGQGDAVLAANNAAGQSQEGATISVRTTDGIVNALVRAGVRTGTYTVRATADRADNNVDNGITDPILGDRGIIISDGRLFNVELTQPTENAITVNPVDPNVVPTPGTVPNSPDGSYSVTVAAIATDRLGNPVIPGTTLKFGLIDHPQVTGYGDFQIAGGDGNPQEGGTAFTAVGGQFRTAGGGAGPGDALVIFGKAVEGNRDLESARVVGTVNSQTSLTVQRRFNNNDDTGATVDYLGALPYVIGRATSGNIAADGATNEFGVARTVMTYPVSRLGRRVIVWAQGEGDLVNGSAETVGDVDVLAFPGVADLSITANPSTIPGNTTTNVQVCVEDALGAPIGGVPIGFSFDLEAGTGTVDGVSTSGTVAALTGADGCTIARVATSGLNEADGSVFFSAGGQRAEVTIVRGELVLQAIPSVLTDSGVVTLRLLNGSGQPQPGYQIVGTCTGSGGALISITAGPGVTNSAGETTATITAVNLNQANGAGSGQCDFQTVDGSAEATVELQGSDICDFGLSPAPPGCTTAPVVQFVLTVNLAGAGAAGSVDSQPGGIACTRLAADPTRVCASPFDSGVVVTLTAQPPAGGSVTWSGECVPTSPGANTARSTMTAARVCNATLNPP